MLCPSLAPFFDPLCCPLALVAPEVTVPRVPSSGPDRTKAWVLNGGSFTTADALRAGDTTAAHRQSATLKHTGDSDDGNSSTHDESLAVPPMALEFVAHGASPLPRKEDRGEEEDEDENLRSRELAKDAVAAPGGNRNAASEDGSGGESAGHGGCVRGSLALDG